MDGDALVAAQITSSHDMPFFIIHRALSGGLPLLNLIPDTTIDYRQNLTAGNYDVVIDIGRDGEYDMGTDILDGGPAIGFTILGTPPETIFTVSANSDFLLPNENAIISVQLLENDGAPLSNINVRLEITNGPGSIVPNNIVTDNKGLATALFSDGDIGKETKISVYADVVGNTLHRNLSIWVKVPFSVHDQGSIE